MTDLISVTHDPNGTTKAIGRRVVSIAKDSTRIYNDVTEASKKRLQNLATNGRYVSQEIVIVDGTTATTKMIFRPLV